MRKYKTTLMVSTTIAAILVKIQKNFGGMRLVTRIMKRRKTHIDFSKSMARRLITT